MAVEWTDRTIPMTANAALLIDQCIADGLLSVNSKIDAKNLARIAKVPMRMLMSDDPRVIRR